MSNIVNIDISLLEQAIYQLCYKANIYIEKSVYQTFKDIYSKYREDYLKIILKNIQIAYQTKRPLCQDTGQVLVFLKIGQDVHFTNGLLNKSINSAVEKCYKENYFRKSVVENALNNRLNTATNTPCQIYTEIVEGDSVEIDILIKGGGSENVSDIVFLNPTSNREDIKKEILKIVQNAGSKSCPPVFIGIGFGKTIEGAALLSKKAFLKTNDNDKNFETELKDYLNTNLEMPLKTPVLDVKILSSETHIACLPVAVSISCHSNRHSKCVIKDNKIEYLTEYIEPEDISLNDDFKEINTDDIENLLKLSKGSSVYLMGEIYTMRDMAHKRLLEDIKNKKILPFDLKDKIIFYAGPCPKNESEVIGPIGPTTSSRMDKYAIE